jgi:hypothetical protein
MSLKYIDFDIIDEIREVVEEVNSGEIHLFELVKPVSAINPFDVNSMNPYLAHYDSYPFFALRDNFQDSRDIGGSSLSSSVELKIAYQNKPLKDKLFAYVNFSDESFVIEGILDSFEVSLSSLITLNIKTYDNTPYNWNYIKEIFSSKINIV